MQCRVLVRLCVCGLLAAILAGCITNKQATTTPVLPAAPTSAEAADEDSGWQPAAPGIGWREMSFIPAGRSWRVMVFAARFDPAAVRFRVHYTPGEPRSIYAWADQTGAAAVINGSFFSPEYIATALVVSDGQAHEQSYVGYGGMFQVRGDAVRVRPLRTEPYAPGELLDQAVQTFPMLVQGGAPAYHEVDGRATRRSVVGIDRAGRVLFIVLPAGGLTLYETSQWLAASDFELDTALNLDGGGSTMLYLAGEVERTFPAFDDVPVVIAVYPR